MKKKIFMFSCGVVLSLSLASMAFAEAIVMSQDLELDFGGKTKCATEISQTGNNVLKCLPGGGCDWTAGSAVKWGGNC